jgi:hypothetical protein
MIVVMAKRAFKSWLKMPKQDKALCVYISLNKLNTKFRDIGRGRGKESPEKAINTIINLYF